MYFAALETGNKPVAYDDTVLQFERGIFLWLHKLRIIIQLPPDQMAHAPLIICYST